MVWLGRSQDGWTIRGLDMSVSLKIKSRAHPYDDEPRGGEPRTDVGPERDATRE